MCPCRKGEMAMVETTAAGVLWKCTSCGQERFVGTPKPASSPIPPRMMRRMLSQAMGGSRLGIPRWQKK